MTEKSRTAKRIARLRPTAVNAILAEVRELAARGAQPPSRRRRSIRRARVSLRLLGIYIVCIICNVYAVDIVHIVGIAWR